MDIFIRTKPYTGPVLAAVFDWAGTAVDYGCLGPVSVFIDVFRKYGVDVAPAEARGPMGVAKKDHVRAIFRMESVARRWEAAHGRRPDETDVERLYPDTEHMMVQSIVNHSDPVPGAVKTVSMLRNKGIKIGSSTGYTQPMMDVLVPRAGAAGYMPDAIVCSSDVPAGRPCPFMCYLNAIRLQTWPLEAMVKVGDTIADIREGLNAGMWTIGLTRTSNELGLAEADVNALPPEELAARQESIRRRFLEAGAHYVAEGIWDCPEIIERINERLARGETPLTV